ncbi:conserved hypothetical protein [Vibrio chagasii]|nr:conserved hypothetical protein [Vibrio chagasii]
MYTAHKHEIRDENKGVYELNCKLAKALHIRHKQELDCQDYQSFGHFSKWDQRSINASVTNYSRLMDLDFTRRPDILLAYCAAFGIDIINSGDKPTAILNFRNSEEKIEPVTVMGESISGVMINAILKHCEIANITTPRMLISDFNLKL